MTLWELIQKSLYHNTAMGNFCDGTSRKHAPSACAKCQLEQWAREKAKKYDDYLESFENGIAALEKDEVMRDLGVPEEK